MTGAIIQARLTSSRFPRKILADINGKPVLEHLVNRVYRAKLVDKIVIASPHSPECCLNEEIFIGSEDDVLDRYYQCAKKYGFDIVVRVTADCPILPHSEIDRCIKALKDNQADYVTNRPYVPDGWDVECMTFNALEKAWYYSKLPHEREHVTPYIKGDVTSKNIYLDGPKLSVDTKEDLERIREYYEYPLTLGTYLGDDN